jgi:nucleoside phosphorylase
MTFPHAGPCLLFALRRETLGFVRRFPKATVINGAPCAARIHDAFQQSVLVMETGVGPLRAERALDWLGTQMHFQPQCILSVGFAGALQESLRVGDLISASEVMDERGNHWPCNPIHPMPQASRERKRPEHERKRPEKSSVHTGRVLTVPRLIGDPEEKSGLGQRYAVQAVDMESATVAAWAASHGIPFGCLRAISDDVHTQLPAPLVHLLDQGAVSPARALKAVVASPMLLPHFYRLARATRIAAEQLGVGLSDWLARPV